MRAARNAAGGRSTGMSWDEVEADADVVLIACCGFDLRRNVSDAVAHAPALSKLRAARDGRVYAVDGNRYFARPAQSLAAGAALVARCAHGRWAARRTCPKRAWAGVASTSPLRLARVAPRVWRCGGAASSDGLAAAVTGRCATARAGSSTPRPAAPAQRPARRPDDRLLRLHRGRAPRPRQVLRQRLPPLLLRPYQCPRQGTQDLAAGLAPRAAARCRVRGRAVLERRQGLVPGAAKTPRRRVRARDYSADDFRRQRTTRRAPGRRHRVDRAPGRAPRPAITGVPLDRASGEATQIRSRQGLAIRRHVAIDGSASAIYTWNIGGWREEALSGLGADLHFPLWHADYEDLAADLRASGVPCDVSATTVDTVAVGQRFGEFETPHGLDAFGERGEFHTLARVWEVPRRAALGV